MLIDDRQFYPSYMCGTVVRNDVLKKHPELEDVLAKADGLITDRMMASMNWQVEAEGREPKDVAADFLREAGLLKEGQTE